MLGTFVLLVLTNGNRSSSWVWGRSQNGVNTLVYTESGNNSWVEWGCPRLLYTSDTRLRSLAGTLDSHGDKEPPVTWVTWLPNCSLQSWSLPSPEHCFWHQVIRFQSTAYSLCVHLESLQPDSQSYPLVFSVFFCCLTWARADILPDLIQDLPTIFVLMSLPRTYSSFISAYALRDFVVCSLVCTVLRLDSLGTCSASVSYMRSDIHST